MAQLPIRNLRLRAFTSTELDRASGSSGEVYYDSTNQTLRVYLGNGQSESLARSDLVNVSNADFLAKANSSGFGGGVQAGVAGRIAYYPSTGSQVNDLAEVYWNTGTLTMTVNGMLEITGQKNKIRFHWDSLADLTAEVDPAAWHGMIAHAHDTGKLYYAHAGVWVPVASESSIPNSVGLTAGSGIAISVTTDSTQDIYTISSTASTGSVTFAGTTVDSVDSSSITFTPQIQFSSSILVDGDIALEGVGSKRLGEAVGGWIEFNQDITASPATNRDFVVDTYNGATHYRWAFDSGGEILFPDGSIQATAYTGNVGSINLLADVDTLTTPPVVGQVLKWNGTNWVPAADATVGGAGTDADTLDGLDSAYFLNFNNLSNKPNIFATIAVAGQTSVVADSVTDTLTLIAGTGMSITTVAGTDTITLTNTVTDTNTTYTVSAETGTGGANLRLTGSDTATDNVLIAGGTNVTVTRTDANTITIASSYADTNTTYAISAETNAAGADIRLTGSDAVADNLTIAAGTNVTVTRPDANTITIASTASGGTASDSFSTIAVAGQSSVVADSSTDTLTLVAGTGISITTNASTDAVTITSTVSSGATAFTGLSDRSDLTVDQFYLPAITRLSVTASGSSAYLFDQYTGNNPTIYAISGTTIAFDLSVGLGIHPFLIRFAGANYNTGLVHVTTAGVVTTGTSAQGKTSGTLYWKIPAGISGTYGYLCQNHGGMAGTITIKDISAI